MISLSPVVVDRWIRRVFLDLDGVVVDFDGYMREHGLTGDEVKRQVGAYLRMRPMPGVLEAIDSLTGMGFELFIATKPPTGVAHAYADKAAWVFEHLMNAMRSSMIVRTRPTALLSRVYCCRSAARSAGRKYWQRFRRGARKRVVDSAVAMRASRGSPVAPAARKIRVSSAVSSMRSAQKNDSD